MLRILKKGTSKEEMQKLDKQLCKMPLRKPFDAKKYCGVLHLKSDPLKIQRKLREEWDN